LGESTDDPCLNFGVTDLEGRGYGRERDLGLALAERSDGQKAQFGHADLGVDLVLLHGGGMGGGELLEVIEGTRTEDLQKSEDLAGLVSVSAQLLDGVETEDVIDLQDEGDLDGIDDEFHGGFDNFRCGQHTNRLALEQLNVAFQVLMSLLAVADLDHVVTHAHVEVTLALGIQLPVENPIRKILEVRYEHSELVGLLRALDNVLESLVAQLIVRAEHVEENHNGADSDLWAGSVLAALLAEFFGETVDNVVILIFVVIGFDGCQHGQGDGDEAESGLIALVTLGGTGLCDIDPIEDGGQMVQEKAEKILVVVGEEKVKLVLKREQSLLAVHLLNDRSQLLLGKVAGVELRVLGIDFIDAIKMDELRHG